MEGSTPARNMERGELRCQGTWMNFGPCVVKARVTVFEKCLGRRGSAAGGGYPAMIPLTIQQSLSETRAGYNLIQAWNESVQDCFMGGVHVAVEKIISPLNHCRLAAICVSRFDGPMLMAFSGLSTDVFFSTHVLDVSQVDAWLPRDVI